jgi:hypothetical protein
MTTARTKRRLVPLADLRTKLGPDDATVRKYSADMRRGDRFPPIELAGNKKILDGNHRIAAAKMNGAATIEAIIHYSGSPSRSPKRVDRVSVIAGAPSGATCQQCSRPACSRALRNGVPFIACARCAGAMARRPRRKRS